MDQICMTLGGRASEEIFFDKNYGGFGYTCILNCSKDK